MKKKMKAILAIILAISLNASLIVAASAEIPSIIGGISESISALTAGEPSVWDGSSSATPTLSGGVYVIDSAAKLRGFANAITNGTTYYGYTVKLTVDIDLNGKTWQGAAYNKDYSSGAYAFRGTLDGDGHYISNYVNTDYGFFRYLLGATIKNLTFKNVNKSSTTNGNRYAGGIVSSSRGVTTFDNVDMQDSYFNFTYSDSSGSRHSQTGAVVGIIDDGSVTIRNCDYSGLTGYSQDARSGMLIGNSVNNTNVYVYDCSFSNTYFYQNSGRCADLGLVVGFGEGNIYIDGMTVGNNTRVVSRNGGGGLVGSNSSGDTLSVKNVTMNGFTITGQSNDSIGCIAGYIDGNLIIDGVTANGLTVSGATNQSGGLVGYVGGTSTVSNVSITSLSVNSTSSDVGSIIGKTIGNVTMKNITVDGATLKNNGTCLGSIVGYNDNGTCSFTGITLKGNISLTNTGGDGTGDIMGNYKGGSGIYFYDITTKDAVITRSVGNKSNQGHILGYSNGPVVMGTKDLAMNELCTINVSEGGNKVGGLFGYIEGDPLTLSNTRINGNVTANAYYNSSTYDLAGAIVADVDGLCTLNNVIITGNVNVKGDEHIGGLIGYAGNIFTLNNVVVGGNIVVGTTNQNVGGLVGKYNSGSLSTISGMNLNNITINATSSGIDVGGLVGWSNGALTIKDTTIASVSISTSNADIGGLIGGTNGNDINISGVSIGSVNLSNASSGIIGGFIGKTTSNTTITDSSIGSGSITGPNRLGGAIGYFSGSGKTLKIENYENKINLTTNVTSTGDTDGFIGGVVGNIDNGSSASITGCSNSGTLRNTVTTAKTKYYGGILGRSTITTTISNCYNTGLINGPSCNGGIVGYAQGVANIRYCYNTGEIKASSSNATSNGYYAAAGIACWTTSASTIEYCFNRGNISTYSTGTYCAGGIVGYLNNSGAKVQYCYSTGTVTTPNSTYYRGYIVGRIGSGTVSYCYTTNSGLLVGSGTASNSSYIAPANLQGSNYVSNTQLGTVYFTTDDAVINDKYPILYWMGDPFEKNESGIWEIWNTGHYNQFLNKVNTGSTFAGETVRLMDDVDLGTLETPTTIGGNGGTTYSFQGTFEGNNHSFSNFTLNNGTKTYTGFFGYIKNATIKDLTLDNFSITGGQYTGGLVGYSDGTSTFSNIKVTNGISVTGGKYTGGLVGYSNSKMTLAGFTATGIIDVNCGTQSGGILGYTPQNITFSGISIDGVDLDSTGEYVGGIIGFADGTSASTITDINSTGVINVYTTSGSYVAGIAGRVDGNFTVGSTTNSVLSGMVVGSSSGGSVAGIVGNHTDSSATNTVKNLTTGNVTITGNNNNCSALIGYSTGAVSIQSVNMGNVTVNASGASSCGALVGWSKGSVTVSGTNTVGNIVINSTGKYLAGLVGEGDSYVSLSNVASGNITVNGGNSTDNAAYIANATGYTYVSNCDAGDVKIYGTSNTKGLIAYSEGNASLYDVNVNSITIGTSTSKAAAYVGGAVGYTKGTANIIRTNIPTVTIYASSDHVGGFVGNTAGVATITNSNITTATINGGANGGGMVGFCVGATISNSSVTNCTLNINGNNKGGFVGCADGSGNVSFSGSNSITTLSINNSNNSYVGTFAGYVGGKLTVSGATTSVPSSFSYTGTSDGNIEQVGAIAGYAGSADISGLDFDSIQIGTPTLRAKYYIGGFIGNVGGALVLKDCTAKDVKIYTSSKYDSSGLFGHSGSDSRTGGLVGRVAGTLNSEDVIVEKLILTAEGENVGGFFGLVEGAATINNLQLLGASSSISNQMLYNGGIIGSANSSVNATDCVNYAKIDYLTSRAYNEKDESFTGGIVGRVGSGPSTFTNCVNYGGIKVDLTFKYTGGIAGAVYGDSTFTNCENHGNIVSVGDNVGGILGETNGFATINGASNTATTISGASNVAGILGHTSGRIDIDDCTNSANITSTGTATGGIVGDMNPANSLSTANDCSNTGTITSQNTYTGGIFGVARTAITNCFNTGTVSGKVHTGGVAGYADGTFTFTSSYNNGNITGTEHVGGVVGYADGNSLTINLCYNIGNIVSTEKYAGGVVGGTKTSTGTKISKCYNNGSVKGVTFVGGLIGQSYATITESFNMGAVNSSATVTESYVGGLAGSVQGSSTASYCYNIGDITITSAGKVGGVVGTLDGTLTSCYNAGTINGANSTSGRAVGYLYTTNASALSAVYAIESPGSGSLASGATDKVNVVEPQILQDLVATQLNQTYFSVMHYFNKGFPVLKWYLDGNNHTSLDDEYDYAKNCNSNEDIEEIYSNYDEVIVPILEEIDAHGKYLTQDEINLMYAKLHAAVLTLTENDADYTELIKALNKVPKDLYYYTSTTADAVRSVVDDIIATLGVSKGESSYNVDSNVGITRQEEVDELTEDLLLAIGKLRVIEYTVSLTGTGSTVAYASATPYRIATVTTPSTLNGQNFSYWVEITDSGELLVSTYRNYSFYVCKNVNLKAVYGADYTPALITTRVLNVRDNGDGSAAILVEHSASKTKPILTHGVLFTKDASSVADLTRGTGNEKVFDAAAATTSTTPTGLFEVTIAGSEDMLYVRSYIIESDGTIHYSEVTSYDMSNLSTASLSSGSLSIAEYSPVDKLEEIENSEQEATKKTNTSFVNFLILILQYILAIFKA